MTTYEPELLEVPDGADVTELLEAARARRRAAGRAADPERVEAMLEYATGDPDEVLFTLQPRAGMRHPSRRRDQRGAWPAARRTCSRSC